MTADIRQGQTDLVESRFRLNGVRLHP